MEEGGLSGLWMTSVNWVDSGWWFVRKARCCPVVLKYAHLFDSCVWRRMALPLKGSSGLNGSALGRVMMCSYGASPLFQRSCM